MTKKKNDLYSNSRVDGSHEPRRPSDLLKGRRHFYFVREAAKKVPPLTASPQTKDELKKNSWKKIVDVS